MRAIELGRAARAQAKVKNRQPLRRAVIVATEAERAEIERLAELVRAELNVKELEFVSEEGELVRYAVKPNYRALGPRFGKAMPQVAAAVAALDPDHVAEAIRGERRIGINIDGTEHTLDARRPHPRDAAARGLRGRGGGRAAPSRSRSSSTTSCAARASRARSCTRSRTPASRRGSTSRTGSR